MIKIKVLILTLLSTIFLISGCADKQIVIEKEYIKPKPYPFEKISMDGTYIELHDKEIQRQCTPYLLELDGIHKNIRDYYHWQIDEYSKSFKEINNEKLEK